MLNTIGETLSEVEIDRLDETLVTRQARKQVASLVNTLAKTEKSALLDTLVARL